MQSQRVSFLRGKRMRATLLNAAGQPLVGDSSVVTTKGFITLTMTSNTEEGEAINVVNAGGESCVTEAATPTWNGVSVEAEFCDVDFALFEILTGQEVVLDANGRAIGITESTDIDMTNVKFALEVWLGASSSAAPSAGSQGRYGYVLLPHLAGGVIGDVTVENAAITFTISGMGTRNGAAWGAGPHKVELVGGVPSVLSTPMKPNDHRRIMQVEVAPPTVYEGATPLLDSTDPAVTSLTTTNTGLSVAITPVPAGTDPMFYDFGDGEWDYTANGSYTHVYDAAGTYTITGKRGSSTVTKSVTVTA
jgi:hypothetical protein